MAAVQQPHELSAAQAAAAIREGRLSPGDLVEALLARIDALDPALRAWVTVDRDGARTAATGLCDRAGAFRAARAHARRPSRPQGYLLHRWAAHHGRLAADGRLSCPSTTPTAWPSSGRRAPSSWARPSRRSSRTATPPSRTTPGTVSTPPAAQAAAPARRWPPAWWPSRPARRPLAPHCGPPPTTASLD